MSDGKDGGDIVTSEVTRNGLASKEIPTRSYTLFVRYLPASTTMEELRTVFSKFGDILPTTRILSMKRIAFVDFSSEEALNAAEKASIRMRDSNLRVERAKQESSEPQPERKPRRNGEQLPINHKNGSLKKATVSSQVSTSTEQTNTSNEGSANSISAATFTSEDVTSSTRRKSETGSLNSPPISRTSSPSLKTPAATSRSLHIAAIPDELAIEDLERWIASTLAEGVEGHFRLVRNRNFKGLRQGFIDFANLDDARRALAKLRRNNKVNDHEIPLQLARAAQLPTSQRFKDGSIGSSPMTAHRSSVDATSPATARSTRTTEPRPLFHVRIPAIPPGSTREDVYKGYIPFGKIRQIAMKNLDLNSGQLVGDAFATAPEEPKQMLASLTFSKHEDAVKAAAASASDDVEGLEVIRDGDSLDVVVGPFSPDRTLAQVARLMSKFGPLSGAKLVKKTTACILTFENEKAAKRACEIPVVIRGVSLLGVPETAATT